MKWFFFLNHRVTYAFVCHTFDTSKIAIRTLVGNIVETVLSQTHEACAWEYMLAKYVDDIYSNKPYHNRLHQQINKFSSSDQKLHHQDRSKYQYAKEIIASLHYYVHIHIFFSLCQQFM